MRLNFLYSAGCLFRLGWITLLLIAVLALVKHFAIDVMPVSGRSMHPNFHDGDVIILNKLYYLNATPKRGDSVVLRFPGDPDHQRYIKRVIGLPGEKVEIKDGRIYINDAILFEPYLNKSILTDGDMVPLIQLKSEEYFLIGDNRSASSDSRTWGPAMRSNFIGRAFYIIFPLERVRPVVNPA